MKKHTRNQLKRGGVVLGWDQKLRRVYLNCEDTHTLVIGATRCGKTRTVVLPSVMTMALAGESIIATDPKGELCGYIASGGEKTAQCIVTVAPPVSEVQISHGTLRLYAGQSSNVLKATVLPGNAADKTVTWQSSDTKIVAVTKDGAITCLAAGQATITASCGGKSASCVVTVVNKP